MDLFYDYRNQIHWLSLFSFLQSCLIASKQKLQKLWHLAWRKNQDTISIWSALGHLNAAVTLVWPPFGHDKTPWAHRRLHQCRWSLGAQHTCTWMCMKFGTTRVQLNGIVVVPYIDTCHIAVYRRVTIWYLYRKTSLVRLALQASHLSPWQGRWMPKLLVEVELFFGGGDVPYLQNQHPCDRKTSNHSGIWGVPKMVVPQNGWWKSWKTLLIMDDLGGKPTS